MKIYEFKYAIYSILIGLLLSSCSDLIVTDVHHERFTGALLQIKVTVKNKGSKNASTSITRLEIKPAGSTTFTRSAVAPIAALTSGQQIELSIATLSPTELPAPGSGLCLELKACADSTDTVSEGWFGEGNNCKTNTTCR